MSLIEEIEKEVSDSASQMTVEVVLLLIDKWEKRIQQDFAAGKISARELLYEYVKMKISLHHLQKKYERDWYYDLETQHKVESHLINLRTKVKEARRNYYVAKQRIEPDQHGDQCSCRGCRCLGRGSWGNSFTIGEGSD